MLNQYRATLEKRVKNTIKRLSDSQLSVAYSNLSYFAETDYQHKVVGFYKAEIERRGI